MCRVGGNYIRNEKLQTDAKRSKKAVCLKILIRRNLWVCSISRASIICIATCYGLDSPWFKSQWEPDFPCQPRPALGPTQTPVQWTLGLIPGGNAAGGWHLASTSI
jgi:hypothetical protein